ncbi:membrane-bound metal-dependent hydrolase [Solidesulfovibrio fructosivorans JJ]]|uniref:Membrane-bound metal-dependent hydrolase n=1 Tax=Solidesulfovibrio fructosivorans JJ] TaxID=596151 RepID=E1K0W2_SOLFR|nr:metal-dependent hydrolase [Solidesulfovibrio fructosivorans]EFL49727.1 membrane-bound metal-dependent hydrolase [Solidesulfovibrio fructosivorans JJ]]
MPGYKTHMAGAAVVTGAAVAGAWWLGVYRPGYETMAGLGFFAILGGLFPDVDTDSTGRRFFYGAALLADAILIVRQQYRYAAVLGFCGLLPAIGSHRGWTHTWWAALLVPCTILLGPMLLLGMPWRPFLPYYIAAVLGYFSHLLLDRIA